MKRAAAAALAIAACSTAPAARADDETFGLAIAIAHKSAGDEAWLDAQIARANELFAPAAVRFRWTIEKTLDPAHAEMHSREDRDALAALGEKNGFVDVFVVDALEDVDEPGRMRRGVVWTHKPDGKRYVVLARGSFIGVLGHELGHFFGNPHTSVPDNLMSYTRTGGSVSFDDAQIARARAFATRFVATGRLVDVGPPRRFF